MTTIHDVLRHINSDSDTEFLQFVQYLRLWQFNIRHLRIILPEIEKRLDHLGYTLEQGCCGTNNLIKKETNK